MRMDPEKRAAWVAALRSGKYTQVKGVLHEVDDGFCCLGVLCDLAAREGVVDTRVVKDDEDDPRMVVAYRDATSVETKLLPGDVRAWAGIEDADNGEPKVSVLAEALRDYYALRHDYDGDERVSVGLTELNDGEDWNFAQIADAIEQDAEVQS